MLAIMVPSVAGKFSLGTYHLGCLENITSEAIMNVQLKLAVVDMKTFKNKKQRYWNSPAKFRFGLKPDSA